MTVSTTPITTTLYPTTASTLYRQDTTAAALRTATTATGTLPGELHIGWWYTGSAYRAAEAFVEFDLSVLPANACISSFTAYFYYKGTKVNDAGIAVSLRAYDFGSTVDNSDWRNATQLSGLPVVGDSNITFNGGADGVAVSRVISSIASSIDLTQPLRLVLAANVYVTNTNPPTTSSTTDHYDVSLYDTSASQALQPRIEVTYTQGVVVENPTGTVPGYTYANAATWADAIAATTATSLVTNSTLRFVGGWFTSGSYRVYQSHLSWDVAVQIPVCYAAATPRRVTLRAYRTDSTATLQQSAITPVLNSWSGTAATSTHLSDGEANALTQVDSKTAAPTSWYEWDITPSELTDSALNVSLIPTRQLDGSTTPIANELASISAGSSATNPPELVLYFDPIPGYATPIGDGGYDTVGAGTLRVHRNGEWVRV
jgi:hypothetical protein